MRALQRGTLLGQLLAPLDLVANLPSKCHKAQRSHASSLRQLLSIAAATKQVDLHARPLVEKQATSQMI
eukprot:4085874-Pleurochrysis_carterae.AAC.1